MLLRLTTVLLILASFCQCKKSSTETEQPTTTTQKLHREHGQPIGAAITKTIDAAGGTLTSADGGLILTVPAGAVDAATVFSIQPVENKLETRGKAYRLLPEGVNFKKAVTLSFSYAASVQNAQAAYLFPVYQDAAGFYFQPKTVVHNAAAKTLTVQTTHFSDWTFTTRVELQVEGTVNNGTVELHKNEMASFEVVKYITGEATDAYKNEVPVLEDRSFATRANINWSKSSGPGNLLPLGSHATYTAPSGIPQTESLVVTVTVDDTNLGTDNMGQPIRQMTLVQPVMLLPDTAPANESYFELKEDGADYRITNPRFSTVGGFLTVTGDFPGRSITLTVIGGGVGSYTYDMPGTTGKASIDYVVSNVAPFVHFRMDDCTNPKGIKYSTGEFTVNKIAGVVGEYTEGTFTGQVFHADWCTYQQQKTVSGKFKIRKNY